MYGPSWTFSLGDGERASKLTVEVFDADIIMQASETFPVTFTESTETEQKLKVGFYSRVPVTPWTGWRFKSLGVSSRVTFVGYD